MRIEEEEWRDIPGYEGRYQASSQGRVRNFSRINKPGGGILSPWYNPHTGYYRVGLGGGASNLKELHRWIAITFIGPSDGKHVNHINGDKKDNRASNLEYVTCAENHMHAIHTVGKFGFTERSRLSKAQVIEIYMRLVAGEFGQDLAEEYVVDRHTITGIKKRKRWSYLTKDLPDVPALHWRQKRRNRCE